MKPEHHDDLAMHTNLDVFYPQLVTINALV